MRGTRRRRKRKEGKASKRGEEAVVDVRRGCEFTLANRSATRERKVGDGDGRCARARAPRMPSQLHKIFKVATASVRPRTHRSPLSSVPLLLPARAASVSVSRESRE